MGARTRAERPGGGAGGVSVGLDGPPFSDELVNYALYGAFHEAITSRILRPARPSCAAWDRPPRKRLSPESFRLGRG